MVIVSSHLILFRSALENDYKLHIYLRISALYLEDGDAVTAETFVNRASMFALDTKDDQLSLKFQVQLLINLRHTFMAASGTNGKNRRL